MYRWVITLVLMLATVCLAQPRQGGETCGTAVPITNLPFADNGLLGGPDDCALRPYHDVFYQLIAPYSGDFTAGMCGSPDHTLLRVWLDGVCCAGASISADVGCGDDPLLTVPLAAGQHVYFECGHFSAVSPPQPYVFQLSGTPNPQCAGTIQIPPQTMQFPPTYVGAQSQLVVAVTNGGTQDLCVDSVRTNGYIWSVSPSSFQLPPSASLPLTVTFAPSFERDFEGTVEFFSSDAANPLDSVLLTGTGCRPAIQPPAPRLFDAGSPSDLYFALPWDQNGKSTEYAVEVSRNNFATSEYVALPFGMGTNPEYAPAGAWGHYGKGLISGLESGTAYQVRLRARDCTGSEAVGAAATLATRDSIVMSDFTVTIRRLDSATVELNWDSTLTDTAGTLLSNAGFGVIAGNDPDSIEEFLAQTTSGSLPVSIGTHQKRFFDVEPLLSGAYAGPKPFIAWPPNGAVLTGWNTVVLEDFVHRSEWDSFRVEIDSAGFSALLGTNYDNTSDLSDRREISADFRRYAPGLHQLTASIVDHNGTVWRDSIEVTVVEQPYTTFHAAYDSARHLFTCDTADVAGISSGLVDIFWNIERVGQRYGGEVFFPAPSDTDSLTIVVPTAIVNDKILDETGAWFEDRPGENGGVTQQTGGSEISTTLISCCCVSIEISTSGMSEHKFPTEIGGTRYPLGPHATCVNGVVKVDFTFEWTITFATLSEGPPAACMWGQDANGTRTMTPGRCGPTGFTPKGNPIVHVKANKAGDLFPYGGARCGDNYRPSHQGSWQNWDDKPGNVIHGLDIVGNTWDLPAGKGGHLVGQSSFLLQAGPECPPIPPLKCCKQFDILWDVTFCENCTVAGAPSPHVLPHMTGPFNPDPCPALAAE